METYVCKTTVKLSGTLHDELENEDVIYNELINNDGVVYTIYCYKNIAETLKNKGYSLKLIF